MARFILSKSRDADDQRATVEFGKIDSAEKVVGRVSIQLVKGFL
jgi:hypothetical protein